MIKYFSIFCFFFFLVAQNNLNAQIVSIPDTNFKSKLIALGVDTNGDSEIQVSEALAITYLDVDSSGIQTMSGILSFTNLDTLICSHNQISNLNVSGLTNLTYLDFSWNWAPNFLYVSSLTNLMYLDCSWNNFTSLDVSNNLNLQFLSCHNNQFTSFDVSNNTNLTYLNCAGQSNATTLISLDLSNNPNLTHLECGGFHISSLDLSNNTNLTYLDCSFNVLTSLDISNNTNLTYLDCTEQYYLTSLDVSNNINLTYLNCSWNDFTSLDVSSLTNLTYLNCSVLPITSLDISNSPNLTYLACWGDSLSSLDVSNNPNLTYIWCSDNQLTSLDVSNNQNLTYLVCSSNQFSSLDMSTNPNLIHIQCGYNPLTSLDVSNNPNLNYLDCLEANNLTSLDVSHCIMLDTLMCGPNSGSTNTSSLISLFMKNGMDENSQWLWFALCHNLQYICADSSQIADVQQKAVQWGLTSVIINSFCSYALGGNHNTITGQTLYDVNANGCSPLDIPFPYLMTKIANGSYLYYAFTNTAGIYTAFADSGSNALTPQLQNYSCFASNPSTANVSFPNTNNNTQTQDFCITAPTVFPDVEIVCMNISGQPNPGFNSLYKLHLHNEGTDTASGTVTLDFMGNKMNVINTSLPPSSQTTNQLTWAYTNLLPFESRTIEITMNILPSGNTIGDILETTATISLLNDADTSDNQMTLTETVVGSFDPNDKRCLEGDSLPNTQIGHFLHYLVRFQNTGTYYAQNVVVVDTLDASKYDIESLQVLDASHQMHVDVINNALQFYFEGIMLPDSFSNEPASHGYVLFKIKTQNTMPFNTSVSNKSEIYFDYNAPVVTNTAVTTFYSHCVSGFLATANTQDVSCYGLCNGIISANVAGGTPPYVYLLNNNPTTATANSLCAGSYVQTVLDNEGCFLTNTYTINTPAAINVAMNITNPILCYGDNATIIASVNGGIAPYQFDWGNGNLTSTAILPAGNYSITVTDSLGCTLANTVTISQPTQLNAVVSGVTGTVNNMNGAIQLSVSGANPPYTYSWSNGQTTQNATQLTTGVYSVTVTDANGCDTTINNIAVTEIVGVEDIREMIFNVYPNPTQTALSVETSETMDIAVYNSLGEVVFSKRIEGKEHIDVSHLSKGVYWIVGNGKGLVFVKE